MIWFGWVLWHINHCRLYNTKSSLYIDIRYLRFDLVELIFWHAVKWFQVSLYNSYNLKSVTFFAHC